MIISVASGKGGWQDHCGEEPDHGAGKSIVIVSVHVPMAFSASPPSIPSHAVMKAHNPLRNNGVPLCLSLSSYIIIAVCGSRFVRSLPDSFHGVECIFPDHRHLFCRCESIFLGNSVLIAG